MKNPTPVTSAFNAWADWAEKENVDVLRVQWCHLRGLNDPLPGHPPVTTLLIEGVPYVVFSTRKKVRRPWDQALVAIRDEIWMRFMKGDFDGREFENRMA